jgi:hypothetical protein
MCYSNLSLLCRSIQFADLYNSGRRAGHRRQCHTGGHARTRWTSVGSTVDPHRRQRRHSRARVRIDQLLTESERYRASKPHARINSLQDSPYLHRIFGTCASGRNCRRPSRCPCDCKGWMRLRTRITADQGIHEIQKHSSTPAS